MALNQLPDFSYKQEVPSAAIINAYQQKAMAEEQMRMNQEQIRQNKINEVASLFKGGASLVDSIQQYNQTKQMQLAKDSLSSLLGDPKTESSALLSSLAKVDPQKAVELRQQMELAKLKSTDDSKNQRLQLAIDNRARLKAADFANQSMKAIGPTNDALEQIKEMNRSYRELVQKGKAGGGAGTFLATTTKQLANKASGGRADPDLQAFDNVRAGMVARIKGLTGDVGVLTEQDAQRLIGLLPDPREAEGSAQKKLNFVENQIAGALKRKKRVTQDLMNQLQDEGDINLPEIPSEESSTSAIPSVGGIYNGERVVSVKRIR